MTSDTIVTHLFRRPGCTRDVMRRVFDLRDEGVSQRRIAIATGRARGSVATWLANSEQFDPHIDDIAVERALRGDRVVFGNLTMFERQAFLDQLVARLRREPRDTFHHNQSGEPWWLSVLSADLGMSSNVLANAAYRRLGRAA